MPANRLPARHLKYISRRVAIVTCGLALVAACAGPETGDDRDPTATPTTTATATAPPTQPPPTATASSTPPPTQTPEPTATPAASPTEAASPTSAPSATPTVAELTLPERLPLLAELPGQGYSIAEEGTRTAGELANAYSDAPAHLRRLEEWGFKQHLFRSFTQPASNDNDPLPTVILTTINEYGSDEQADAALVWLRQLGTATGATAAEAPQLGDNAVALTVPTSDGVPTASIYIRDGAVLFVYFAEGGDPLPAVDGIAKKVFGR